ncbi:hypothetical protein AHF37_07463 [Paragonimus kellicotti]|nr:hypothetical protein AHF37_07463 [Paragonimus kellicotti]
MIVLSTCNHTLMCVFTFKSVGVSTCLFLSLSLDSGSNFVMWCLIVHAPLKHVNEMHPTSLDRSCIVVQMQITKLG